MNDLLTDFRSFLHSSPTSWHAALEMGNRFALKEFTPLNEQEKWQLEKGGKYFVQRGGSICAFILPENPPTHGLILGAHTDSPALKLKPNPIIETDNMITLGVEVYGAPMLSSWLNRDLAIAGRIIVSNKNGDLEEKLIFIDDVPLVIPQLAIHLDKEINEKGVIINKQDHLAALVSLSYNSKEKKEFSFLEGLIRREHFFTTLISHDLFLVPIEESRFIGYQSEMLASYRLDNLASAHAITVALSSLKSPHSHRLNMGFCWDHEEIGSATQEGASSPFCEDILKRIASFFKFDQEEFLLLKNHCLGLSVDMAQGFNPNYANKYDVNHRPLLGKGIVIKFNANQKYVSSALSAAHVVEACRQLTLNYQNYAARSDLSSGSTIGPLFATALGIPTVDIGCAQLSMHSSREVMACSDHLDMCQLLTHFVEKRDELRSFSR